MTEILMDQFCTSFSQQRLWFLDQYSPGTGHYNIPAAWLIEGELDCDVLQMSLQGVIQRHEILRTVFVSDGIMPAQMIAQELTLDLAVNDLSINVSDVTHAHETAHQLLRAEAVKPFDLVAGPLLRAGLIRLPAQQHIFFLTLHHIIADGWSLGILMRDLSEFYRATKHGESANLPELPIQYADFSVWQRDTLQGDFLQMQMEYWRRRLVGAPQLLQLPTDKPRPALISNQGASLQFELGAQLSASLQQLSQQQHVTLFVTMVAAFNLLLHRYSQQTDICVGYPVANRSRPEVQNLIGFFANTLVLRTRLDPTQSFQSLLKQMREDVLDMDAHQDLPFEKIVEELRPERNLNHTPLFQVMFAFYNSESGIGGLSLPGLHSSVIASQSYSAKFDLSVDLIARDGLMFGLFEYNSDLFEPTTIQRMIEHYRNLLHAICVTPEARLDSLPIMSTLQQEQVLRDWNQSGMTFPDTLCVHQLFEAQVEKNPAAIAVVFADQQYSYEQLNARANQLARHLRLLGVRGDSLVAICLDRGLDMVVALLATLKAGAAYVPMDPDSPPERLAYMLTDTAAKVLLTQQHLITGMTSGACQRVNLARDWHMLAVNDASNLQPASSAQNLAYCIYTSGSTGAPKAVQITHQSLCNFLYSMRQAPALVAEDVMLSVTPLTFDIFGLELYLSLLAGARVVIASKVDASSADSLAQIIAQYNVTVMQATPATWRLLQSAEIYCSLRCLLCGGEALDSNLAQFLQKSAAQVWNLYGPTETTIWSCRQQVFAGYGNALGQPIGNTQIYVLDGNASPLPYGVVGEICIAGDGLARGYWKRPDLTAEKFIPNPFGKAGSRIYRTGDLGRLLADGRIEFLGRIDHQVKVRGFRIELGEIENALLQIPQIREAVVVAQPDSAGEKRLVAYLVSVNGDATDIQSVRQKLQQTLPEYMLPVSWVFLPSLPLNTNGKVDRKALPLPDTSFVASCQAYVEPRSATEQALAAIWCEILQIERIGVNDNFFALGGHSLFATQIISKLRSVFKVNLPLRAHFEAPTIASLAQRIDSARVDEQGTKIPPIEPGMRQNPLALSFSQERLWLLDQIQPGNTVFNMPSAIRLMGQLDLPALRATINEIVRRHEALRTSFMLVNGTPVQVIADVLELPMAVTDLSGMLLQEREAHVQWLAQDDAQTPFDLTSGPLIRCSVIALGAEEHVVLLNLHHIVSDGWSMGILVHEVAQLYSAYRQKLPSPLPSLPIQYADFAQWQRRYLSGEVLQRQLDYWLHQLAGVPQLLTLPSDRPRPAQRSYRGAEIEFAISKETTAGLHQLNKQAQATMFMSLTAAFNVLVSLYSGQSDIAIGTFIANRNRAETESLIGFFVNTLVMRTKLDYSASFLDIVNQVRKTALDAYANQDLPFEQLLHALQLNYQSNHAPLFQALIVFHNTPMGALDLPGLTLGGVETAGVHAQFDLSAYLTERGNQVVGAFEYNTDLFERERIAEMVCTFTRLLDVMVLHSDLRLLDIVIDGDKKLAHHLQKDDKNLPHLAPPKILADADLNLVVAQ